MNTEHHPHHGSRRTRGVRNLRLAIAGLGVVALAACGSDDAKSAATTTATSPPTTPATTPETDATTPASTGDTAVADDLAEYCAVAVELDTTEDFPPSADLLTRYTESVPPELAAQAEAVKPLIAATSDPVAFFVTFADDDVAAAVADFDAFEGENCGIDKDDPPADGSSTEAEPGIPVIDVVATDYAFAVPPRATPGRTTFRLTNDGKEAHFMSINKLKDGVSVEDAIMSEDPSTVTDGSWETELAAPGGEDEEFLTLDLEPGNYALFCFIPGPTGDPHAFMGMQAELIVS